MNKTDNATRQVQRSLTKAIVLRNATPLLAAWLFIWGTAVLALRITIEPPSLWFAYGIAGIPAALLIAAIQARRQIPDSTAIRAKLDAINHDGGMLMASAETNLPEWKENIVISHLPTAHWRNLPSPAVLIAAIVFIAASMVMPIPHNIIPGDNAMAINDLVDDFQAKIDVLDEEELVDEARAESLRESLSKISEDADGDDPIRTWEALDNVADSINDISDQAASELEKLSENAAAMQSATENIRQSMQDNGNTPQLSQAMQELASLMESKNLLNAMNGDIPPELAQALKTAKLSPEQLQQLAQALKKCQSCSSCKMAKLCKAKLVSPDKLAQCKKCSSAAEADLIAFLCENNDKSPCDALIAIACNAPGNGGINRGRGDAPMTWTDGTDENGTAFKDQLIQPSAIGNIDKTRLTGISKATPQKNDSPVAPQGGMLTSAMANGGGTHKQQILPQHKQAVMRYFHREDINEK